MCIPDAQRTKDVLYALTYHWKQLYSHNIVTRNHPTTGHLEEQITNDTQKSLMWITYYQSGNMRTVRMYRIPNPDIMDEGNDGCFLEIPMLLHGYTATWGDGNKLVSIQGYVNNIRHGRFFRWDHQERPYVMSTFVCGNRHGPHLMLDTDHPGHSITRLWDNGRKLVEVEMKTNGQKVTKRYDISRRLTYEYVVQSESGYTIEYGSVVDGKMTEQFRSANM